MDIKRNLLILALGIVSYLLLLAWNEDNPAQPTAGLEESANPIALELPADSASNDDIPAVAAATAEAAASNTQTTQAAVTANTSNLITVDSPTQHVQIDLRGGDIVGLSLPLFPVSLEQQDTPFPLLQNSQAITYISQSGLIGRDGPDASGERPLYRSSQDHYEFSEGQLEVDLQYDSPTGVRITKRYVFSADDYLIRVSYLIDNNSQTGFSANLFGQIKRNGADDPSNVGGIGVNTFLGAVMKTQDDPYVKEDFDDIDDGVDSYTMPGGWIGFSQHYFLGSWIPSESLENTYSARRNNAGDYLMGFVSQATVVPAGSQGSVAAEFWAGPKDQYRLEEISPDLNLTIDYGKLWFVAYPIYWTLSKINDAVGNYGLAIILLTLLIRLLFFPLSIKQFRSQAAMRRLQPKIVQLRDKYGDDKQKLMQAQMDLWKKEKVNPFSGCLPPLLQMPFFLGIFWVLRQSVEVRQAPFIFWYQDLSQPDAFFVLPILLAGAYFLQQHMTPMMTTDPTQAKVMKFMPVMFGVFFLWFPAGLVLYSLVNALTGILQQASYNWFTSRQQKAAVKS